jgi:hypothetical protein
MKTVLDSNINTGLLGLAALLCALLVSTVYTNAQPHCEDGCVQPSNCLHENPRVNDTTFIGSVGTSVCPWYYPCCSGFICWWEDSEGFCGGDDYDLCTVPESCQL